MILNEVEATIIAVIVLEFAVPLLLLARSFIVGHNNKKPL